MEATVSEVPEEVGRGVLSRDLAAAVPHHRFDFIVGDHPAPIHIIHL